MRPGKRLRTRTRIQAEALRLFRERGYQETTLAAVAEAADVALRTVTLHFPAKEDLVFADLTEDRFSAESLAARLQSRAPGETTLEALRSWMAATMAEVTGAADTTPEELWRQRATRSRVIVSDPELLAKERATYLAYEQVLAVGFGEDFSQPPDALVPRLAALTANVGLKELLVAREASGEAAPSSEHLLGLIDRVLSFVGAGIDAALTVAGASAPTVRRSDRDRAPLTPGDVLRPSS